MSNIRTKITQSRWIPTPGNILLAIVLCVFIVSRDAWAEKLPALTSSASTSAMTLAYQGQLSNADGTPVNATVPMTFALYDALTGGTKVWGDESHADVPVQNGLFSVRLGSQTENGIPSTIWQGDLYLAITIDGEPLSPREPITYTPIPDGTITGNKLAEGLLEVPGDLRLTGVGTPDEPNINLRFGSQPGNVILRHGSGYMRTLHFLPWGGEEYTFDRVCIGCGSPAGLLVNGDLDLRGDILNGNLLESNVGHRDVSFGNVVVTTDADGYARVDYPDGRQFPTNTAIVVANNGDYNAGNFTVNLREKDADGFNIRLINGDGSVRAERPSRIFYIAIGH